MGGAEIEPKRTAPSTLQAEKPTPASCGVACGSVVAVAATMNNAQARLRAAALALQPLGTFCSIPQRYICRMPFPSIVTEMGTERLEPLLHHSLEELAVFVAFRPHFRDVAGTGLAHFPFASLSD
jgi:hypothetical protein